jgi:hypothetical protein
MTQARDRLALRTPLNLRRVRPGHAHTQTDASACRQIEPPAAVLHEAICNNPEVHGHQQVQERRLAETCAFPPETAPCAG